MPQYLHNAHCNCLLSSGPTWAAINGQFWPLETVRFWATKQKERTLEEFPERSLPNDGFSSVC